MTTSRCALCRHDFFAAWSNQNLSTQGIQAELSIMACYTEWVAGNFTQLEQVRGLQSKRQE